MKDLGWDHSAWSLFFRLEFSFLAPPCGQRLHGHIKYVCKYVITIKKKRIWQSESSVVHHMSPLYFVHRNFLASRWQNSRCRSSACGIQKRESLRTLLERRSPCRTMKMMTTTTMMDNKTTKEQLVHAVLRLFGQNNLHVPVKSPVTQTSNLHLHF